MDFLKELHTLVQIAQLLDSCNSSTLLYQNLLSEDLKDRNISSLLCLRRGLAEDVPKEEKEAPGPYTAVNAAQWFPVIRQKKLLAELRSWSRPWLRNLGLKVHTSPLQLMLNSIVSLARSIVGL
jgi:hypothetical protein